jgi:hypothetical protein
MSNYTRERSRYGGYIGSIQIHATNLLANTNDPNSPLFRSALPSGFLRCDGSVKNASEFLALSKVLGVGSNSRFRKENQVLQEPDADAGTLGQFQLPDLGSKVLSPGLASGTYNGDRIDQSNLTKVGPEIEVISNSGNKIRVDFGGTFNAAEGSFIDMRSNPKMIMPRNVEEAVLDIVNFQGHAHNTNATQLNITYNHATGGQGKDSGAARGNSGAGHIIDFSSLNSSNLSIHKHRVEKPFNYTSTFQYKYNQFDISIDGLYSELDIDVQNNLQSLDQVVTPFILVEYIIKF